MTTPGMPVTVENFCRAETDMYFGMLVKRGGLGRFDHLRDLHGIEGPGVRPNRDTLYSEGVFDLDAGPVTVSLPDAGGRYLSLLAIDEDHYAVSYRKPDTYHFDRESVGTRYVFLVVRIFVNPDDANDIEAVHALQDALTATQQTVGEWEPPAWDPVSQKTIRDALLVLSTTLPDLRRAGGRRDKVDPVRHLLGTASGWGLNPDHEAIYLNVTPERNDGGTVYRLTVPPAIPVDGFWSVSVYDAAGHFIPNERQVYTINSTTAARDDDGSVTVLFGDAADGANVLPITSGWNYMVRLYRPRPEVLDGSWTFPEIEPAS
jgi:hypothetical protein